MKNRYSNISNKYFTVLVFLGLKFFFVGCEEKNASPPQVTDVTWYPFSGGAYC